MEGSLFKEIPQNGEVYVDVKGNEYKVTYSDEVPSGIVRIEDMENGDGVVMSIKDFLEGEDCSGAVPTIKIKEQRNLPKSGDVFVHFKGKLYTVICLALHTETNELMVVYKRNNEDTIYVRPLNMFMSEVDKEKYPDVKQKYRFEFVGESTTKFGEVKVYGE